MWSGFYAVSCSTDLHIACATLRVLVTRGLIINSCISCSVFRTSGFPYSDRMSLLMSGGGAKGVVTLPAHLSLQFLGNLSRRQQVLRQAYLPGPVPIPSLFSLELRKS